MGRLQYLVGRRGIGGMLPQSCARLRICVGWIQCEGQQVLRLELTRLARHCMDKRIGAHILDRHSRGLSEALFFESFPNRPRVRELERQAKVNNFEQEIIGRLFHVRRRRRPMEVLVRWPSTGVPNGHDFAGAHCSPQP